MANRSYIYGLKNNKHLSIGEYPYKIPYAFRILAAFDNSAVDSDLFDKAVGIKADFQKGRTALYRLLDYLIETGQMEDHEAFVTQVAATKTFLDAIDADFILLENGEIYSLYTNPEGHYLDGPGLERANDHAVKDYQWIGEDIDNLEKFRITPDLIFVTDHERILEIYKWLIDLKDTWKEQLGLDAWSNILYFQFKEA